MMRTALALTCLFGAQTLFVPTAGAAKTAAQVCPKFPGSPKMKLESVANDMSFSDVPMDIRRFESSESPEEVLAFYRGQWGVGQKVKPGSTEYPLGPWQVIASLQEPCFFTVQVKPYGVKGGSEGFLGTSAPPPERTIVKENVPMLPGSKMVNDLKHNDSGKQARTVMLTNNFSPAANADFYRKSLADAGWTVQTHYRGEGRTTRGDTMVLKNGLRELSVTITSQGKESSVLLNYVDQP